MAQKFVFEDGSWMLLRLSGTEPAASSVRRSRERRCIRKVDARSITMGTAKLKKMDAGEKIQSFLQHYGRALIGLLVLFSCARHFRRARFSGHAPHAAEIKKVITDLDQ